MAQARDCEVEVARIAEEHLQEAGERAWRDLHSTMAT